MRSRAVKVRKTGITAGKPGFSVGGWYCGEHTYLWFGADGPDGPCAGALHGKELLRLARRIVREFERGAKGV